jgi:HEAT repeat protein
MSGFGLGPLPRTYDAALRDSRDRKAGVRLSAVRDLARHAGGVAGSRAVKALLDVLANDSSAEVRGAAAVALADSGSKHAVDGLVQAGDDPSDHVRQMALLALGEVSTPGDERVLATVERALVSDRASMRFQALIALSRLATERAGPAVLNATTDSDAEVRHLAFRVLEERATETSDVVRIGADIAKAARDALEDESLGVRLCAAILLVRSGDRAGTPVIVEAVNGVGSRVDFEDLSVAIALSADLELEDARPGLMRRAWGGVLSRDPLSYESRIALARMGDARARSAIVRGLSSWSRDTRTLAVVAAGRARVAEARPRLAAMRGKPSFAEPEVVDEALARIDETPTDASERLRNKADAQ